MAFNIINHLHRQVEWSTLTFGPGERRMGVTDHILKELVEIEKAPKDLSEWVDVIILGFDGAWRAGWVPETLVAAFVFIPTPKPTHYRTAAIIGIKACIANIRNDFQVKHHWREIIIYAISGAILSGFANHEIMKMMIDKQTKNEARKWPDWRTMSEDKAIEHDRSGE